MNATIHKSPQNAYLYPLSCRNSISALSGFQETVIVLTSSFVKLEFQWSPRVLKLRSLLAAGQPPYRRRPGT